MKNRVREGPKNDVPERFLLLVRSCWVPSDLSPRSPWWEFLVGGRGEVPKNSLSNQRERNVTVGERQMTNLHI